MYYLRLYKNVIIILETFLSSKFHAIYWILNHIFLTKGSINRIDLIQQINWSKLVLFKWQVTPGNFSIEPCINGFIKKV